MATTTNYGWTTPDDTALVKDGASAIRTLGSSADTTVKNLNAGTTAGDLDYYTAATTKARIAIGSAGQVLTVSAGVPAWSTLAASGFTKITSGSFSSVATVDIDNVFSTTYLRYMVVLKTGAATSTDDLHLQFRYAGPTTETGASYYGAGLARTRGNVETNYGYSGVTAAVLSPDAGAIATEDTALTMYFQDVGQGSALLPKFFGNGYNGVKDQGMILFSGSFNTARVFTGFRLKSSSTNITGTYAVYGLAN